MDDQLVSDCINLMQEEPVPNPSNSNFVITEFLRTKKIKYLIGIAVVYPSFRSFRNNYLNKIIKG